MNREGRRGCRDVVSMVLQMSSRRLCCHAPTMAVVASRELGNGRGRRPKDCFFFVFSIPGQMNKTWSREQGQLVERNGGCASSDFFGRW